MRAASRDNSRIVPDVCSVRTRRETTDRVKQTQCKYQKETKMIKRLQNARRHYRWLTSVAAVGQERQ